jgi:tRNA pseudouridine55 synthase
MDGFLLVDKPAGISSFGVVARVRRVASDGIGIRIKVGHTGTLDPMATGLLILVLGNYTRRASEYSALDKTYEAQITLGSASSTGDAEGEITKKSNMEPTNEEIGLVLKTFLGKISQEPPAHSAIKVKGQRAYKLARQGIIPILKPRDIIVHDISDVHYTYPTIRLSASVSSGTYIRSLAVDIGEKLGTGAYLSALRRTKVGDFGIKEAAQLEDLDFKTLQKNLQK